MPTVLGGHVLEAMMNMATRPWDNVQHVSEPKARARGP